MFIWYQSIMKRLAQKGLVIDLFCSSYSKKITFWTNKTCEKKCDSLYNFSDLGAHLTCKKMSQMYSIVVQVNLLLMLKVLIGRCFILMMCQQVLMVSGSQSFSKCTAHEGVFPDFNTWQFRSWLILISKLAVT